MAPTDSSWFYDEHPFDWVAPDSGAPIRGSISPRLADFIESLDAGSVVFDIGCGPGRVLNFLTQRGIRCIGLDRSSVSVRMALDRCRCPVVVGDNLHLPFADGAADVVISDGVIHHTGDPRAAFLEGWRALKPGGRMYLAVYKPFGRYPWLYKYPGAVIRSGLSYPWLRPLVVLFARLPYFLIHLIKSRGQRTWSGARNLFYDYFVTPSVAFLSRGLIEQWCADAGASIVVYDENRGENVHSFCLVKESQAPVTRDPGMPGLSVAETRGTA